MFMVGALVSSLLGCGNVIEALETPRLSASMVGVDLTNPDTLGNARGPMEIHGPPGVAG